MLLQNDANVVFADIALRLEAKELVDEYSSDKDKPQAIFQQTDVTDWKQLDQMFQVAMKYFGTIDIVCPGAGVYEPHWSGFWYPPGSAESKDAVDGGRYAQLDINLTHPIRSTQLAISYFIEQRKKTPSQLKFIIHISSIAGQSAGFGTAIYGKPLISRIPINVGYCIYLHLGRYFYHIFANVWPCLQKLPQNTQ